MFSNRKIYAWVLGSIVLLTLSALNMQAMERCSITLPDASTLEQRLSEMDLEHFLKKTQLHKTLGGQEKHPLGVVIAVELALYDYNKNLNNPIIATMMQMQKPNIIKAISEDAFYAFEEAKKKGYKHSKI